MGGVRLISSARTMLAKIGPGQELEHALPGDRIVLNDFGAGDVGRHQVGRELDALERHVERLRQRADHQASSPGRERRPSSAWLTAEDRHQQLVEHFFLADDDLADLGPHLFVGGAKLFEHLLIVGESASGRCGRHGSDSWVPESERAECGRSCQLTEATGKLKNEFSEFADFDAAPGDRRGSGADDLFTTESQRGRAADART